MGHIDRYLLSQLMAVFGLASLVLVLVYWINQAVRLFDQLIADGQSAWVFLELTALALPTIIKAILPVAGFAATLYALARMSGDSEIIVVQATGASPWRLARPVLLFGLIVGVLVAILGNILQPLSLAKLNARQAEIAQTATARLLREGEFISPTAGLTLYIRDVTPEGELRGVLLSDSRSEDENVAYSAASAYIVRGPQGPQLVMIDGSVQRLRHDSQRLVATTFADFAYDLGPLMPADDQDQRSARELFTWELLSPTPALAVETREPMGALFSQAQERLAEPLLAPAAALVALGALLAARFSRLGLWPQIIMAVVLVIVLKGVESGVTGVARDDPTLWPLLYLPSGLGLAAGAVLLWLAARPRRVPQEALG